eukprot:5878140-Prymnesium_polylepis.6
MFFVGVTSPVAAPIIYSLSGLRRTLDRGEGSSCSSHSMPSMRPESSPVLFVYCSAPRKVGSAGSSVTHPAKQATSQASVSCRPSPPRTIVAPKPARWEPPPRAWAYAPSQYTTAVVGKASASHVGWAREMRASGTVSTGGGGRLCIQESTVSSHRGVSQAMAEVKACR